MKPDNIIVTDYDRLGEQTAETANSVNGDYLRSGDIAGCLVDECTLVCAGCATSDELSKAWEDSQTIMSTDEWDCYSGVCEECGNYLDTYVLVYRKQDTELWHKLQWNQQLGNLSSPSMDYEELCEEAERQAYNRGYVDAKELDSLIDIGSESPQAYAEANPMATEPPTDSAMWANSILPDLRAMSGYVDDMGTGTYKEPVCDVSYHCFNEGVITAYRSGWYDKCVGNDKSDEY